MKKILLSVQNNLLSEAIQNALVKKGRFCIENALSVTIKRLRDKLGAQKYIKTVYGIGYSWVTKDE